MSESAFIHNRNAEIDAAWFSMARTELLQEQGLWANHIEPTEEQIRQRMSEMDVSISFAEPEAS